MKLTETQIKALKFWAGITKSSGLQTNHCYNATCKLEKLGLVKTTTPDGRFIKTQITEAGIEFAKTLQA